MNARALALIAGLAALGAQAAHAQAYESAHFGKGRARLDCAGASSCDNSGTALKVTGGYVIWEGIAVELGYVNFGQANAKMTSAALGEIGYKSKAFTLGLAYQLPISGDFGASFRLGAANITSSATQDLSGSKMDLGFQSVTKAYWGLGLNYAFTKHFMVEGGMDMSRGAFRDQKIDLRAITIGARYNF